MRYGQARTVGTQTSRLRNKLKKLSRLFLIASILPLSLVFNGCAGLVSATKQSSSAASLQVNPASVNFGQVVIGKQATQTVSVSNTGKVGLNITQCTLSNPRFSLVGMTTPMAVVCRPIRQLYRCSERYYVW